MLSNDIMHFIGFSLVIISIFFFFCSVIFFVKSVYSIFFDIHNFVHCFSRLFIYFFITGCLYFLIVSNADILQFEILSNGVVA